MSGPLPDPAMPAAYRVLILPHCSACGESLRLLLAGCGYDAEVVRGSDVALRRAREILPQAVLVDLHLPGGDGRDVGRRLRAGLGGAMRLIGVTPYDWDGDPAGWAEAGFNGWLRKPLSPAALRDLLAAAPGA